MQGRNSVYESSRSAECPRLGRANILPDRCRWWWGSEGRAPPEKNDSNHFIVNALNVEIIDDEIAARDEKKKEKETIFPPIFESQPRDLRPSTLDTRRSYAFRNAARLPLHTRGNTISIFRRQDVRHVGIETFRFSPQAKCRFA